METLKPKLRFQEHNDSYKLINFHEVIDSYGYGPRFNANDYFEDGNVKTIRGTDISLEGEIKYHQVPTALLDKNTVKTHKLLEGDLVMITTADCGLTGVFREQNMDFIPSAYAVRLRLNKNTNPFYFKYFFQTKLATKQVDRFIRKATVANLPASDILKFEINLPSIQEQTKIANFLSSVDEKINLLKDKKSLLEDYKKGIIQKIFNQELRFKDDNGNDFGEWETYKLKDLLIENKTRNRNNNITEVFSVAKSKGVINQIEHLGRSYASDNISNYKVVFENDLIYTKSPTSDFPYGIIKQNKLNRKGVVSVLYGIFTPNNKYIGLLLDYYFSNWKNTYNYLDPIVQKGAKNTINIGNETFLNGEKIRFPKDLSEQTKIANFLSAIDEKIELVLTQIEDTQEYKKGLLQQMFI